MDGQKSGAQTPSSETQTGDRPQARIDSARFQLLVESVKDYAIFMLDPQGRIATWNSGAERINGYRASEAVGRHFSIFYPANEIAAGKCELELEVATRDGRFEEEGWRLRKDGTRLWADVVITALRDTDGSLVGFAKVTRDLTDRRDAAEEARRFQLLVESVKDYAIFILDAKGQISTWNSGAERMKGYTASEAIGRHFSLFYPREDVAAGKCEMELEVASTEGRFEEEGWRLRKDGTRLWANVTITALRNPEGKLVGFAKVTRDLTERRAADEERLRLARADEVERRNQEFLAIMGHELRNPLAPMVTALHRIKLRGGRDCDQEIAVLGRQLTQMSRLVNDILDASRLTRNEVRLQRAKLEIGHLLADAVDVAAPLLEGKRQELVLDVEAELFVNGDRERLTQVFGNVLSNAAKYTDRGGKISLSAHGRGDSVEVAVADNGIGIDAELLPHVFQLFTQAEQGIDRREGGLGIGLSVARSLVLEHGGSIVAESAGLQRGSRFVVTLPRLVTAAPEPPIATHFAIEPSATPRRVLIVDDNRDAAEMMELCLRDVGHDVRVAFDGEEAVQAAHEFSPEVVFLDIGLPGLSGYQVAEKIRQIEGCATIPLVAVTGYAPGLRSSPGSPLGLLAPPGQARRHHGPGRPRREPDAPAP